MVEDLLSKDKLVFSFTLTYILLITTGTITFIEAIRTNVPMIRHIFNLETVISVIAGYFYGKFVQQIKESFEDGKEIDYKQLVKTRYLDWAITTPLMLMVLVNVIVHHNNQCPKIQVFAVIIVLNYIMLYSGYKGEMQQNNTIYWLIGFAAFFLEFFIIYYLYLRPKYNAFNYGLFFFFLIVWSMYGVIYKFDIRTRNIMYNFLDLIAKCFVGIGLWVYFTKLFTV